MKELVASENVMHGASPSVLVVDDDEFAHEVLREMLGLLGVSTMHSAEDGRKALKVLEGLEPPPDFLICDVFMPDMDGIEFLEQLAGLGYAGGIVILSGVDAQMLSLSRELAATNGLNILGAFIKPVGLQQLSNAMELPVLES
jgi:CheY-like chemotaxis protein